MNTKRNITQFDQKLYLSEHGSVFSSEKIMYKKEFWEVLIASLVILGLMVALILIQKPVTGELSPIPFYPYAN